MFQAQQVDFSLKEYFIRSCKHLWGHQFIYLFPLTLLTILIIFMETFISITTIKNGLQFFIMGFAIFFFMEITFSSTQEKYTFKKYLTSMMVASLSFIKILKSNPVTSLLIFTMMLTFSIFNDVSTISMAGTQIEPKPLEEIINKLSFYLIINTLFKNVSGEFMDIILLSACCHYSLSDYFILYRSTGLKTEPTEGTLVNAMLKNRNDWVKILFITFVFSLLKALTTIAAPIIFILIIIAITFYSMDIFGIDTQKKVKQEETLNEKVNSLTASYT